jgi:hypothetical protein
MLQAMLRAEIGGSPPIWLVSLGHAAIYARVQAPRLRECEWVGLELAIKAIGDAGSGGPTDEVTFAGNLQRLFVGGRRLALRCADFRFV